MASYARTPAIALLSLVLMAMAPGACAAILGYDAGELEGNGGADVRADRPAQGDEKGDTDGPCTPVSCTQNSCGSVNSCGTEIQCSCSNTLDGCDAGACTGCTWTCTEAKAMCGTPNDLCSTDGGLLDCGTCFAHDPCNAFHCDTDGAACVPLTCSDYPDGSCGNFQTGCDGGTRQCDNCPSGTTCTGSSCCPLYTCANYPGQCGSGLKNNCGGTLSNCGCDGGDLCSDAGLCCTPLTSCPPGHCDTYKDPCSGEVLTCVPCDAGADAGVDAGCTNGCGIGSLVCCSGDPPTCGGGMQAPLPPPPSHRHSPTPERKGPLLHSCPGGDCSCCCN